VSILPVSKGQSASDDNQFPPVGTGAGKSILQFDLILQAIEQSQPMTIIDFPQQPRA
jgi:hypothetical protein